MILFVYRVNNDMDDINASTAALEVLAKKRAAVIEI
jgi:hypothetical protein